MTLGTPVIHAVDEWAGGADLGDKTTPSFTPQANAILFAFVWDELSGGGPVAINDTAGLFDPTPLISLGPQGPFASRLRLWSTDTDSSPSSMTVTFDGDAGAAITYAVFSVSGNSPQIKSGQITSTIQGNGTTGATASTGTLPAAAAGLTILCAGANRDSSTMFGVPTDFTRLTSSAGGSGAYEGLSISYSTTFTGTSTTYSNTPDNENYGNVLLELEEAGIPSPLLLENGLGHILAESGQAFTTE